MYQLCLFVLIVSSLHSLYHLEKQSVVVVLYIRVCCIDDRVLTFGVGCGDDPVPFSFISDICYVDNLVPSYLLVTLYCL